jgi:hypothetical protein
MPSTTIDTTDEMALFLLTKPRPRISGRYCQSRESVDRGDGVGQPCRRPMWNDGRVNGEWWGLCSRCWHSHQLIHGGIAVMRANPASHTLTRQAIAKLTFHDTFPPEWLP